MNKKISLPAINVQQPISREILCSRKTIETRFYPIPKQYLKVPMWLIETPGLTSGFSARAIAIVVFDSCFQYKTEEAFYSDQDKHLVGKDSVWGWKKNKKKWGWKISQVIPLETQLFVGQRRGIVYTKSIVLPVTKRVLSLL